MIDVRTTRATVGMLVALASCGGAGASRGGGQGGGPVVAQDGGVAPDGGMVQQQVGPCVETTSLIAPAQVTVLGFSAHDVLAATGGAHTIDLAWIPETLYATHARASTRTAFTLTFAATPTAVRFIDSQGGGCPDRGPPGYGRGQPCIVCSSRLEIDVGLSVVTGDGALDEQLTVTFKTTSTHGPRFGADLAAADVKGSYFAAVAPSAGYGFWGVHIEAGFGVPFSGSRSHVPDQWNGYVAAQLVQGSSTRPVMQAHGYFPGKTAGRLVP
jgi:hypothetical protein